MLSRIFKSRHTWQYLPKSHQLAMEERVCRCGAHVRGPTHFPNGDYTGTEDECPIEVKCNCGRDGCPSAIIK